MVVKDDLGGMAGAYELIDWHDDFGLLWQSANYTGAETGAEAGAEAGAGVAVVAVAAVAAVAAVVAVAAVAVVVVAAVAAVAAAGAGSRLSTDGRKQNERIATIRIILISSKQRWEGSFEALTNSMAFASGLVIRYTIFIFLTLLCNCNVSDFCDS